MAFKHTMPACTTQDPDRKQMACSMRSGAEFAFQRINDKAGCREAPERVQCSGAAAAWLSLSPLQAAGERGLSWWRVPESSRDLAVKEQGLNTSLTLISGGWGQGVVNTDHIASH